jgi:hypothetical protein
LSFGKSQPLTIINIEKMFLTRDSITADKSPLPPPAATEEEDELLFQDEPYVEGPINADYGYNVM